MFVYISLSVPQIDFMDRQVELRTQSWQPDVIFKPTVRPFEPNCFKSRNSFRVSFIGHGGLRTWGGSGNEDSADYIQGNTPEQFIQKLKDYQLPQAVKTIDLIGCNIGLRVDPDYESYIQKVARLLANEADPNFSYFKQIQVRGFQFDNLDNKHIESIMLINARNNTFTIKQFTAQNKEEHDVLYDQMKESIEELAGEFIPNPFDAEMSENILERLEELRNRGKQILDEYENSIKDIGLLFIKSSDVRKTLDSSLQFAIKPYSSEINNQLRELIEIRNKIKNNKDLCNHIDNEIDTANINKDTEKEGTLLNSLLNLLKENEALETQRDNLINKIKGEIQEKVPYIEGQISSTSQSSTSTPTTMHTTIEDTISKVSLEESATNRKAFDKKPPYVSIGNRGYLKVPVASKPINIDNNSTSNKLR